MTRHIPASHLGTTAADDLIAAQDAAWRRIDEVERAAQARKPAPTKASQSPSAPAKPAEKASQTSQNEPRKGTGIDRSATKRAGRVGQEGQTESGREKPNQSVVKVPPGYLLLSPAEVEKLSRMIDSHPLRDQL